MLEVELVDWTGQIWKGEASQVIAPGVEGDFGVLVGREPILSVLRPGQVRIKQASGDALAFTVDKGFVSCDQNRVTLVVESATAV